ncbi:MAG TPA: hypothetical protein VM911_11880 [Pyrinomonadaceae bacterium]|nr:hypothetical protein [Pyrinomonadaceae bacterium]
MPFETIDYGGDDDSTSRESGPPNELDDIFGTPVTERRRPPARASLLAELDMRVMLQVLVAFVLLLVAGGLLARDVWVRKARDTAFRQMVDANSRREYLHVIEGAEKFLSHAPLNGSRDAREADVISLYSEALVHWVAQQPGKLDSNALAHVSRYKQLVKNSNK